MLLIKNKLFVHNKPIFCLNFMPWIKICLFSLSFQSVVISSLNAKGVNYHFDKGNKTKTNPPLSLFSFDTRLIVGVQLKGLSNLPTKLHTLTPGQNEHDGDILLTACWTYWENLRARKLSLSTPTPSELSNIKTTKWRFIKEPR